MLDTQGVRGAVAVTMLILAASCGAPPEPTPHEQEGEILGDSLEVAPDFTLQAVDGSTVTLSQAEGEVRLIDFWATWCAPCREEIPMFKELQEKYGDRGFRILAVSDEDTEDVRSFVERYEINYQNLVDPDEAVSSRYGVVALPTAYLVDRGGNIVETYLGPKVRRQLEARILELLDEPEET